MAMTYTLVKRRWPVTKKVWIPLLVVELLFLIPLLVLFGIAQPDLYRSKFWKIGWDKGFNSNPNIVIFAMVNARPLPTVPFVWSQMLTDFNVAISVLTLFILMVKMITLIMKVWYPIIATVINGSLVALWATSTYGQMGPDFADPNHPSPVAWYIAKSCSIAAPYKAEKSCKIAKATFAMTVCMLAVMVVYFGITVWAMWPTKTDVPYDSDDEDDDESETFDPKSSSLEMQSIRSPRTPMPAMTPRTQAFNALDRRLPLRQG